MAKIARGCCQPEVVQLGWMQLVRHVLDVTRDFVGQLPKLLLLVLLRSIPIRRCSLLKLLDSVRQEGQPLGDVIVQLARDPASFFLMCFNQPSAHRGKSLFCELAIRDIDTRAYVSGKRTVGVESRHNAIEEPAIFAVMPPEPILHVERLTRIESLAVAIQTPGHVFWVDPFCPAV